MVVRAVDNYGEYVLDTMNLTVTPVNDAPIVSVQIADTTINLLEEFTFTIPPNTFSDIDGNSLIISTTNLPSGLSFNASSNTISGTLTIVGTSAVIVTANDVYSSSVSDTFIILVDQVDNIEFVNEKKSPSKYFVAYPNSVLQSTDKISLFIPLSLAGSGSIAIYDPVGSMPDYQTFNISKASTFSWDLMNMQGKKVRSGVYVAVVKVRNNKGIVKLSKIFIGIKE